MQREYGGYGSGRAESAIGNGPGEAKGVPVVGCGMAEMGGGRRNPPKVRGKNLEYGKDVNRGQ